MVRTKEFDEDIVIDRAVQAFLRHSYSSTSVSDLEVMTGVGRKSLYNTFGNKHELLLRALDRFAHESTESFVEPLEKSGAGRAAVERVVKAMVTKMTAEAGRNGCLLCLSAQDPIGSSKPVAKLVDAYFARARAGFLQCIKVGVAEGDVTSRVPPQTLADYFVGVLMGISTMARTGATSKAMKSYAKVALRALD